MYSDSIEAFAIKEQRRMVLVNIVAVWEGFCLDFLHESFLCLIQVVGEGDRRVLYQRWKAGFEAVTETLLTGDSKSKQSMQNALESLKTRALVAQTKEAVSKAISDCEEASKSVLNILDHARCQSDVIAGTQKDVSSMILSLQNLRQEEDTIHVQACNNQWADMVQHFWKSVEHNGANLWGPLLLPVRSSSFDHREDDSAHVSLKKQCLQRALGNLLFPDLPSEGSLFSNDTSGISEYLLPRTCSGGDFRGNGNSLSFKNVTETALLVRMLYGFRCVYAHDDPTESFEKAMSGFDSDSFPSRFRESMNAGVNVRSTSRYAFATALLKGYEGRKKRQHKQWISTHTLINIGVALTCVARCVVFDVGRILGDFQGLHNGPICIWSNWKESVWNTAWKGEFFAAVQKRFQFIDSRLSQSFQAGEGKASKDEIHRHFVPPPVMTPGAERKWESVEIPQMEAYDYCRALERLRGRLVSSLQIQVLLIDDERWPLSNIFLDMVRTWEGFCKELVREWAVLLYHHHQVRLFRRLEVKNDGTQSRGDESEKKRLLELETKAIQKSLLMDSVDPLFWLVLNTSMSQLAPIVFANHGGRSKNLWRALTKLWGDEDDLKEQGTIGKKLGCCKNPIRFYYGLRCTLAHDGSSVGDSWKTFPETKVLASSLDKLTKHGSVSSTADRKDHFWSNQRVQVARAQRIFDIFSAYSKNEPVQRKTLFSSEFIVDTAEIMFSCAKCVVSSLSGLPGVCAWKTTPRTLFDGLIMRFLLQNAEDEEQLVKKLLKARTEAPFEGFVGKNWRSFQRVLSVLQLWESEVSLAKTVVRLFDQELEPSILTTEQKLKEVRKKLIHLPCMFESAKEQTDYVLGNPRQLSQREFLGEIRLLDLNVKDSKAMQLDQLLFQIEEKRYFVAHEESGNKTSSIRGTLKLWMAEAQEIMQEIGVTPEKAHLLNHVSAEK